MQCVRAGQARDFGIHSELRQGKTFSGETSMNATQFVLPNVRGLVVYNDGRFAEVELGGAEGIEEGLSWPQSSCTLKRPN